MREAVLAAVATEQDVRIRDLTLEVEDEQIPARMARRLAVELAHEGLLEIGVTRVGDEGPHTVVLEELTPIGRHYLSLLEDRALR